METIKDRELIIDRLKRALEMEEEMAIVLIDTCNEPSKMADIPEDVRSNLVKTLEKIKNDTVRHKNTVEDILKKMEAN